MTKNLILIDVALCEYKRAVLAYDQSVDEHLRTGSNDRHPTRTVMACSRCEAANDAEIAARDRVMELAAASGDVA